MPNVILRISKTGSLGLAFTYTTELSPVHNTADAGIDKVSLFSFLTPSIFADTNIPGLNTSFLLFRTTRKVTVRVLVFKIGSIKSTCPLNSLLG